MALDVLKGQMTVWDLMPEESLEMISEKDMAARISSATGIPFAYDAKWNEYRAKFGKRIFTVSYDRYETFDERNGIRFIGCGVETPHNGAFSPRDNIQEAIDFFQKNEEVAL